MRRVVEAPGRSGWRGLALGDESGCLQTPSHVLCDCDRRAGPCWCSQRLRFEVAVSAFCFVTVLRGRRCCWCCSCSGGPSRPASKSCQRRRTRATARQR